MRDLSICPACQRDYVRPVESEEADQVLWEITLHCGNCGRWETGVFDQPTVERFDDRLDHQIEVMVRAVLRVERASMVEDADRFAAALSVDAILPEDFL